MADQDARLDEFLLHGLLIDRVDEAAFALQPAWPILDAELVGLGTERLDRHFA